MIFSADIDPCAFASVVTYLDKQRRVKNRSDTIARIVEIYHRALRERGLVDPFETYDEYKKHGAPLRGWDVTDPVDALEVLEAYGFAPKSERATKSLADEIAEAIAPEQAEAMDTYVDRFADKLDGFIAEIDEEDET